MTGLTAPVNGSTDASHLPGGWHAGPLEGEGPRRPPWLPGEWSFFPNFCPVCGHDLQDPRSLTVGYWRAEQTLFACWCAHCDSRCEVTSSDLVITTEPAD